MSKPHDESQKLVAATHSVIARLKTNTVPIRVIMDNIMVRTCKYSKDHITYIVYINPIIHTFLPCSIMLSIRGTYKVDFLESMKH